MSNQHPLNAVGDVLIKAANLIDTLEEENRRLKEANTARVESERTVEAQKLAQKFTRATGEDVDVATIKKIASSKDDDVKALFNKLASFEEADELGGVHQKKTAARTDMASEDSRFLRWINS